MVYVYLCNSVLQILAYSNKKYFKQWQISGSNSYNKNKQLESYYFPSFLPLLSDFAINLFVIVHIYCIILIEFACLFYES